VSVFSRELGERNRQGTIEASYSSEPLAFVHHEQDGTGCCFRWCDTGVERHAAFVAKRVKANPSIEMTMETAINEC
jgi:hypothetical protein